MTTVRKRLENGFEVLALGLYRFRWLSVATIIALAAVLSSGVAKLELDTSNEAFLHKDDPTLVRYSAFKEQFGRDDLIILSVRPDILFSHPTLAKLKALHEDLSENVPHLNDITSMINARSTHGEGDVLVVEDLLRSLPRTPKELSKLKTRVLSNPLYINSLVDSSGSITTIIIELDAYSFLDDGNALTGFDDKEGGPKSNELLNADQTLLAVNTVKDIVSQHQADNFQIETAGMGIVVEELKGALKYDMSLFLRLAVLAIGTCLFLIFRRITGVILPLFIVALALLSTLGLMGHVGVPLTIPSVILPSFLLAVGVGAAVHVLTMFYRYLDRGHVHRDAIRDALGHSGLAIVMTSLTTAVGLSSFAGAELAPVAHLGIFASFGVLLSLLYTIVLLPALLAIIPIKSRNAKEDAGEALFERLLDAVADFSTRHARVATVVTLLIIVVSVACAAQLRFSHDVLSWLPSDWPIYQATRNIDRDIKGSVAVDVIVDSGRENGLYDRDLLRALDDLATELNEKKIAGVFVAKVTSVVDILKEIHRALNENRSAYYAVPDNAALIPQEFLLFENSGSDDLGDVVDSRFQVARISIRVPWHDTLVYVPLVNEVARRFAVRLGDKATITVTGTMSLLSRTLNAAIRSAAESYVIAIVVITALMALLIGNLRIGILAMLPNLAPIAVTMGLMWGLGLPLNLFTMLVGSIAIGLAVDDTIHFMHNFRRYYDETGDVHGSVHRTLHTTGRAMLVTSVVLAVGFYIFTLASLNNVIHFGVLTGTAILLALAANFILAPALMVLVHKKGAQ